MKRFLAAGSAGTDPSRYEVRFETPPGVQAQVDFARFEVNFTDEPGTSRVVWLFSLVLGHSRFLFARFVLHQDLQTRAALSYPGLRRDRRRADRDPLRPHEDRGDRRGRPGPHRLQPLAARAGAALSLPAAGLPPYRAKTKGKVERPFRYIRQDFFLARSFRNLDDLNAQLVDWLDTVANPASTAPPNGLSPRRSLQSSRAAGAARTGALTQRAQAGAAGLATTASSRSAATATACLIAPAAGRRGPAAPRSDPHPRISAPSSPSHAPILEGRKQYRIDPASPHRRQRETQDPTHRAGSSSAASAIMCALRSLAIYQAIGAQLPRRGAGDDAPPHPRASTISATAWSA